MTQDAANAFLDQLRSALGVRTDVALGEAIGVPRGTISTWRKRGTVPEHIRHRILNDHSLSLTSTDMAGRGRFVGVNEFAVAIFLKVFEEGQKVTSYADPALSLMRWGIIAGTAITVYSLQLEREASSWEAYQLRTRDLLANVTPAYVQSVLAAYDAGRMIPEVPEQFVGAEEGAERNE